LLQLLRVADNGIEMIALAQYRLRLGGVVPEVGIMGKCV
jgi:hypothetical protein